MVVRDALTQYAQLNSLVSAQRATKALIMFHRDAGNLPKHPASFLGEMQLIVAAIFRAPPPLDDPLALQVVHQRDHAARHHSEMLGESLLADSPIRGNLAQQSRISRR